MAYHFFLFAFYLCFYVLSLSLAQPFRAVNLGNWLVTEGWMKPSLFDGIPNKDLLDGTRVQFFSIKLQRYLCAENAGGTNLVANRINADTWETFALWRINENFFYLRLVINDKQFVGLESQGNKIVAISHSAGDPERFQIIRNRCDPNRVRLQASNGKFIQVQSETLVIANYDRYGWEDDNPSVFRMNNLNGQDNMQQLQGEYQITNGYGPIKAPIVMQSHWKAWITEEDFRFISKSGINAVRIPVGWWIAFDPTPPKPFVGGSLQVLDKAFYWAGKYGMKVIVDLHAARGSQNGNDHSSTIDGSLEWGDSKIQETVNVIDFLAKRYASDPSLVAIELLNEPLAPMVSLETLLKYYQAGYNAVRKYTQNAYVIFSNRLGPADSKELLSFATNLNRVVIDVHFYNLFNDQLFKGKSAEWNINNIRNDRASQLSSLTIVNGPLTFVGEWTGEWEVVGALMQDYQKFVNVQQEVYRSATFGWAYWSYKLENPKRTHWSFKCMIEYNYLKVI
ncbi:conserved hypothetical protein [Ricinus communis]|uniref:Uncharacterized protein n=1 Tax=Ricinus communis TaxID=3988 RepID=B9T771_RICCO|nr:conserved hypothetical protein [Ricinus communis]